MFCPCPVRPREERQLGVFARILEEIDDLLQVLLLLLQTGHILERDAAVVGQPRLALAEIHHLGVGSAAHVLRVHHVEEEQAYRDDQEGGEYRCHEGIVRRYVPDRRLNAALSGDLLDVRDAGRIQDLPAAVAEHDGCIACVVVPVGRNGDFRDLSGLQVFLEVLQLVGSLPI